MNLTEEHIIIVKIMITHLMIIMSPNIASSLLPILRFQDYNFGQIKLSVGREVGWDARPSVSIK